MAAAYSESDLTAIRAALVRGERVVRFADRTVEYRSVDELQSVEARILSDLSRTAQRPRQFTVVASKGLQ